MSEQRKIVVPEGMLKEATNSVAAYCIANGYVGDDGHISNAWIKVAQPVTEAVFVWLAENPIVPTDEQIHDMYSSESEAGISFTLVARFIAEWQRRMLLLPDEDAPIRDLLVEGKIVNPQHNAAVRMAFQRGLKAGSK